MLSEIMFSVDVKDLGKARSLCHDSIQWASKAARANIEAAADDSHSSLTWSNQASGLLSAPLDQAQKFRVGFSFRSQSLLWVVEDAVSHTHDLASGDSAQDWVDRNLVSAQLETTGAAVMPYELPPAGDAEYASLGNHSAVLGEWFSCADATLRMLVNDFESIAIARPEIRCWPHHFDIAVLFAIDEGDPYEARSIGIGMSPGDESYDQPYFYCTPWPVPSTLGDAADAWRWHTDGFTSMVCTADSLNPSDDLSAILTEAMRRSIQLLRI